jgi:NAD(P)-dependent dehydrogenase (short-subunit alcohol dehydrogenase family)
MNSRAEPPSKPWYYVFNIDVFYRVAHQTFLHPIIPWFLPLAYRAQGFQYHHPPLYLSAGYAFIITLLWLIQRINIQLAFGAPRTFDWTEEVVLITGGASGLGLLIAEVYGMRGVSVAVLDKNCVTGESEARNVYFYQCDVGDVSQVEAAKKRVEEELGTVTVLINNAAVVHGKPLLQLSLEDVETSFRTNIMAHYNTLRLFLPGMVNVQRGSVVTVSSVLATLPPKACSLYAPTKAATTTLHHALTAELAEYPFIKTLLVTPGQMSTPLFNGVKTPNNFWAPVLEPVDVAKEVIAAIDEGKGGEIAMPLFSRWAAVFWVLPVSVRRALRALSGMDKAMEGFRGAAKKEE